MRVGRCNIVLFPHGRMFATLTHMAVFMPLKRLFQNADGC